MNKIEQVLTKNYSKLRKYPNVISISTNSTKFTSDLDTGQPCITVFVSRKLKNPKRLKASEILPKEIDGVLIDVVELSTPDYKIGETSVSKLSPFLQKKIAGGLVRE